MLTNILVNQEVNSTLRAASQFQISSQNFKYAWLHDAVWLCEQPLTFKQLGCLLLLPLPLLHILLSLFRCSLWHLLILYNI